MYGVVRPLCSCLCQEATIESGRFDPCVCRFFEPLIWFSFEVREVGDAVWFVFPGGWRANEGPRAKPS